MRGSILVICVLLVVSGCRSATREAHDNLVEQDRQRQAAQVQPSIAPSPTPQASATPSPAQATAPKNYWTNFRGPKRDGRYDETPISTHWPDKGLPLIWKQPVGVGHASFVVADGKAYTIEQRRNQEVVAA